MPTADHNRQAPGMQSHSPCGVKESWLPGMKEAATSSSQAVNPWQLLDTYMQHLLKAMNSMKEEFCRMPRQSESERILTAIDSLRASRIDDVDRILDVIRAGSMSLQQTQGHASAVELEHISAQLKRAATTEDLGAVKMQILAEIQGIYKLFDLKPIKQQVAKIEDAVGVSSKMLDRRHTESFQDMKMFVSTENKALLKQYDDAAASRLTEQFDDQLEAFHNIDNTRTAAVDVSRPSMASMATASASADSYVADETQIGELEEKLYSLARKHRRSHCCNACLYYAASVLHFLVSLLLVAWNLGYTADIIEGTSLPSEYMQHVPAGGAALLLLTMVLMTLCGWQSRAYVHRRSSQLFFHTAEDVRDLLREPKDKQDFDRKVALIERDIRNIRDACGSRLSIGK